MPTVTYRPNDILIINDDIGSPAAIVSTQSDSISSFIDPFPGGEAGCCLPDGTFCISNDGEEDFAIYDQTFTQIATVSLGTEDIVGSGIQSNRLDKFYIFTHISGSSHKLRIVAKDGTIEQTLAITSAGLGGPCVQRDGSIAYWFQNNTVSIKRFDLNTLSFLTDLYTVTGGEGVVCGAVDASGNIWYTFDDNSPNQVILRQFNVSGTILQEITVSEGVYVSGGRSHISSDDSAIWVWLNDISGSNPFLSGFKEILFNNGSTRHFTESIPTKDHATNDAISNSCPLIVLSGSSNEGRDDCGGGSLVGGGTPGGGGDSGCNSCDPDTAPPPSNWPAPLLSDLMSVGINNCWDITFIYAVEPLFNARGFTGQVNSSGALRGRFYEGYPVPDFSKYFDTNGPTCGWLYSPHGITII